MVHTNNFGTSYILKHQPREFLLDINFAKTRKQRLLLKKISASMLTLPAEIWLHICKQLCMHCRCKQMPEFGFGNEEIDIWDPETETRKSEYKQGKSALAALSLTSRDMRDISQPVLYHCFYDDPLQDKASKFLHTLIAQPRLADCVRVLALPEKSSAMGNREYYTRRELETWHEVSTRLEIPPPRWISRAFSGDEPTWLNQPFMHHGQLTQPVEHVVMSFDGTGPESLLRHIAGPHNEFWIDVRLWQHFLLVGLCCNGLTHLAVSGIYGSTQGSGAVRPQLFPDLLGPGQPLTKIFDFPRLRVFSCTKAILSGNSPSFFSQAKVLNQVAVGDIDWPRASSTGLIVPLPLNNVRKLSLSCPERQFVDIIKLCDHVQDLEFHLARRLGPPSTVNAAPYSWPASIKQGIRRLCWTSDVSFHWGVLLREGVNLFPPLSDFQNLEILEIDRVELQIGMRMALGLDPNAPEEFSRHMPDYLPPSIRILHFSRGMPFILSWSTLVLELEVLAAAKTTSLPMLSVIQIDEKTRGKDEKTLAQVMEAFGVVRAMKDAGIELRFGRDPSLLDSRRGNGMRPYLPGNLHGTIHLGRRFTPAENYLLED